MIEGLIFMVLTTIVVVGLFAVIPGMVIIMAGALIGLLASLPILGIASLILLTPGPGKPPRDRP